MVKMSKTNLLRLLNSVRRKQYVGGKPFDQIESCVVFVANGMASTTSLVKDGKTSLNRFSVEVDDAEDDLFIVVPDIDRLVGVLSAHGENITLKVNLEKLMVKSGRKQTSLLASSDALAYAHSDKSVIEWAEISEEKAKSIVKPGDLVTPAVYKLSDGSERESFVRFYPTADGLYEALRCDSLNAQKLNRYTFAVIEENKDKIRVDVGDFLKGKTTTTLDIQPASIDFEVVFEGGLEFVLQQWLGFKEPCQVHFFDFRPENQGIRALFVLPDNNSWVFQAGVF